MHLSPTTVFAIATRVLVAICTRTFFQPDEYFQSLEPAHNLVFGYGMLTWEWLSPRPIRSILYPALNVPIYWILKVLGLDNTKLLILAPKMLHGILAAGTDIWVRELARKVVGERYVSVTYFVSLTSLFHVLALSRSLSNSLETMLTTIALSYFPWDSATFGNKYDLRLLLCFAALACCIRITNVVIWVFLLSHLLWRLRLQPHLLRAFLIDLFAIGSIAVLILFATDSIYYGRPVLTPLSFLLTNASSVSLFYGTSPWHYYLTQGLPILCGPALPFVLHGAWRTVRPSDTQRPTPPQTLLLSLVGWASSQCFHWSPEPAHDLDQSKYVLCGARSFTGYQVSDLDDTNFLADPGAEGPTLTARADHRAQANMESIYHPCHVPFGLARGKPATVALRAFIWRSVVLNFA